MGIFKDTYIINQMDTSSINANISKHNRIIKESHENDIKARDRVDIQLSEYTEMKDKIKKQDTIINSYETLYKKLAEKLKIDLNELLNCEIDCCSCEDDVVSMGKKLKVIFNIPFDKERYL